jgi:hypothetical protein
MPKNWEISALAMEQLPSFSMGNPPAVGPSVTYVTQCKKYRYGDIIARKDGARVRLYSRPGDDVTWR